MRDKSVADIAAKPSLPRLIKDLISSQLIKQKNSKKVVDMFQPNTLKVRRFGRFAPATEDSKNIRYGGGLGKEKTMLSCSL